MTSAGRPWGRRRFLFTLPAMCAAATTGRNATLALAPLRYDDLATDLPVIRLTDPGYTTWLPGPNVRSVARKGGFLLFGADLSGRREVYRLDLKKVEATQLTETESLGEFVLMPDERGVLFSDGGSVLVLPFGNAKPREVYRGRTITALNMSADGLYAAVVEEGTRLVLVNLRSGEASQLAEGDDLRDPVLRPKRASVLYRRAGNACLANYDGKQNYTLRLGTAEALEALWSPDGRSVLYLSRGGGGKLNEIREFVPDTNQDAHVADTTQFGAFDRNANASMFVGVSASAASPYVLLLARAVGREFPLCEHKNASAPVFSPNSQLVFFCSELHGKPSLYAINAAKFVAQTGDA